MTEGRSTEVVRIDALVCGPDFQELMSEPRVLAIAERVAINGGSSTLPIVRAGDMNVLAGEDIIAAHCILDIDELTVELVHDGSLDDEPATEFSPHGETQCARTEVTPPPVRTHTPEEWAEMNRAAEANLFASGAWQEPDPLGLRPDPNSSHATLERVAAVQAQVGTQSAAVAAVAAETGRSEHAVKKAVNRAKRAKDKVSIETWGREQPAAWLAATTELRRAMTTASNSIRTAMSALSPLVGDVLVPGVALASTYEALKTRAAELRAARPACVCAWCKNEPALVERCVACGGRGWLGEQKMTLVPRELFPAGSAMAQGRPVELDRYKAVTHTVTVDVPAEAFDEASMAPASEMTWAPLYHGADAEPLESCSHTVEPVSAEHAEAAWDALEEANVGEDFLDDAALEDVPDDGGLW